MRQSIQNNFLPPESQILQSTILGDKGAVNQVLKSKLSVTGLSHFMAIDGLHIVILISIVNSSFVGFGYTDISFKKIFSQVIVIILDIKILPS